MCISGLASCLLISMISSMVWVIGSPQLGVVDDQAAAGWRPPRPPRLLLETTALAFLMRLLAVVAFFEVGFSTACWSAADDGPLSAAAV